MHSLAAIWKTCSRPSTTPNALSDWKPSKPIATPTIGQLLDSVTHELAAAGCASPRTDAELLLCHATGKSRFDLVLSRRDELADASGALEQLTSLVARRVAREPLQHILGTAPMCALDLDVGPGVFIPRPETELLAQWAIDRASEMVEAGVTKPTIVDLCTGSGALALAIADTLPNARIYAVELDDTAIQWTRRNINKHQTKWADRHEPARTIDLRHGDATDPTVLADIAGTADIVVSNPPYVPDGAEVSAEVLADPRHAVFGGNDGLDVIRPMMNVIAQLLRYGGVVGIEHDDDSAQDIATEFHNHGHWEKVHCHRDLAGRDRFTTATLKS